MAEWTIDNYDGRDSYEELHLEIDERHLIEPELKHEEFHKMRKTMVIIEGEMDEALAEHRHTPTKAKKKEWHDLKNVVLSMCDDYLFYTDIHDAKSNIQEGELKVEIRDDHVVSKPEVSQNALKEEFVNESEKDDATQYQEVELTTTLLRSGRKSAEEFHHVPGDQEDLVDRNGRVKMNPRGANVKQQGWSDTTQAYKIKGWSDMEIDEDLATENHIGCFFKGQAMQKKRRTLAQEEEDSDDEPEQMVCNMTGQKWERLLFPIIIDSGGCASVVPIDWCSHIPVQPTQGSETGTFFRVANGVEIPNEGERLISMMTREGVMRDMKFIVCPVTNALGSVSQMCKTGHRLVFKFLWGYEGSYI